MSKGKKSVQNLGKHIRAVLFEAARRVAGGKASAVSAAQMTPGRLRAMWRARCHSD
jgi:hypothetical protein